jgi:hypothetical protein
MVTRGISNTDLYWRRSVDFSPSILLRVSHKGEICRQ